MLFRCCHCSGQIGVTITAFFPVFLGIDIRPIPQTHETEGFKLRRGRLPGWKQRLGRLGRVTDVVFVHISIRKEQVNCTEETDGAERTSVRLGLFFIPTATRGTQKQRERSSVITRKRALVVYGGTQKKKKDIYVDCLTVAYSVSLGFCFVARPPGEL